MKKLISTLLLLMVLLTGCKENGMEKREIIRLASDVAIEYMKVKKDKDFVVTGNQLTDDTVGMIFIEGYAKGDKANKLVVSINYANDFKVEGWGEGVGESTK